MSSKNTYSHLPLIKVFSEVEGRFGKKKTIKALIDIFDDDFWSSKVSVIGNSVLIFLIILSSFEIILSSDTNFRQFDSLFKTIDYLTSIVFTIEILSRIVLSSYFNPKYKGIVGKFRYIFSFYGLIDIISIIPFWGTIMGLGISSLFKIVRIFRLWRIVRFVPSFSFINNAFKKKGEEILVSLFGVLLLSVTISALLFYSEQNSGSGVFKSITHALSWSLGKYTGDYGKIAEFAPVTFLGKILATINGLLGIALFALPAGLLASAFIDEFSEQKRKKEINNRIKKINNFFDNCYLRRNALDGRKAFERLMVFETVQAKLLFSEDEILTCIRESANLRYRAMKSRDDIKFNDTKIIERFVKNVSYGCKILNSKSNVFIINPMGATERCISHFTYTIIDNLGFNYLSKERRCYTTNQVEIGSNYSKYYSEYETTNSNELPIEFKEFMSDIQNINQDDFVLVICSGASGRGDFIIEYGNGKGKEEFEAGISTINSVETLNHFISNLHQNSSKVTIKAANTSTKEFSFTTENHTKGNYDQEWIGKTIHRLTGANVITLYINVNILIDETDRYFSALNVLLKTLENTFGNFKESKLSMNYD